MGNEELTKDNWDKFRNYDDFLQIPSGDLLESNYK